MCDWRSEYTDHITIYGVLSILSTFASNSGANASELLENVDSMFPCEDHEHITVGNFSSKPSVSKKVRHNACTDTTMGLL